MVFHHEEEARPATLHQKKASAEKPSAKKTKRAPSNTSTASSPGMKNTQAAAVAVPVTRIPDNLGSSTRHGRWATPNALWCRVTTASLLLLRFRLLLPDTVLFFSSQDMPWLNASALTDAERRQYAASAPDPEDSDSDDADPEDTKTPTKTPAMTVYARSPPVLAATATTVR